jgi:hypothetical protein
LFLVAQIVQSLQLGTVDGEPFRAEVTLLPGTKAVTWNGRQVPTCIHQHVAHSGGRILEIALDWYAQADDGSVWYFGEDGVVADTHGTWLAGRDGQLGMIMPANPSPGQVHRPENIPELVFEEVTVRSTGQRVPGPGRAVDGAVVVRELHLDGATEEKTFAPGYGEFSAGGGGDVEAVALAVPVDAAGTAVPAELTGLAAGARAVFDAAGACRWAAATKADAIATAWKRTGRIGVPDLLGEQMTTALARLGPAVDARDPSRAGQTALRAEQAPSTWSCATGHRPRSTSTRNWRAHRSMRSTSTSGTEGPPSRSSGTAPATLPTRRPATRSRPRWPPWRRRPAGTSRRRPPPPPSGRRCRR